MNRLTLGTGAALVQDQGALPEDPPHPHSALHIYRRRTLALLHRYLRMSVEIGRLPAVLGGDIFRAKITSYRLKSFEDAVIFVHDVENSLNRLRERSRQVICRVVFEEYSQTEAAHCMGLSYRMLQRCYSEAIDELSAILLELRLILPLPATNSEYLPESEESRLAGLPAKKPCGWAGAVDSSGCEPSATRKSSR